MKISCIHGYFIFEETKVGQVSDFISYSGLQLVAKENYFTFENLLDTPKYSLPGAAYLNLTANALYEGTEGAVMRANGFVYDFINGELVDINTVDTVVVIQQAGNRFVSSGLILPGSITDDGIRVKEYSAWFSRDTQRFNYSELSYE